MKNLKFNEYFLEILKRNGYSKNQLSKTFGINRGALHKYFNGTLILPKELLCKILDDMIISPNERTLLWDLYYADVYGHETLNRIKTLEQILLNIDASSRPKECLEEVTYTIDFTAFVNSDNIYLKSENDILSAVRYLFEQHNSGKIYTNFPYSLKKLDDTVYNYCLKYPSFELVHLLYFNKITDYFENLQNIFYSVRYLKNQINPICRYIYGDIIENSPYPFFFAVNNYCLFFSPDCNQGFLYHDADMFSRVKKIFNTAKYNDTPLAIFTKDIIETKNVIASNIREYSEITLCHYPCLAPIADADFINSLLKKEVPEIHKLATIAIEHYSQIFNSDIEKYILDESGFREFAETGKVFEVPSVFINPAKPSYKIQYFKKLKQFNEVGRLKIIDNTTFKLPKSIALSAFDQWVELYGAFDNIPDEYRYSANWIIKVQDKQIVEDIRLFIDYLEQTKNFYTQKGATGLLNSMIECCK